MGDAMALERLALAVTNKGMFCEDVPFVHPL